jgi:hypothetical protein
LRVLAVSAFHAGKLSCNIGHRPFD